MAQKNKVDNAPKTQPSIEEMQKFYAENQDRLNWAARFESASNAVKQLKDYTKTSYRRTRTFNKELLRQYLLNISGNEKNLRELSRYLTFRSQVYYRLQNYCANMFVLDARQVIPDVDLTRNNNVKKVKKNYYETLRLLDKMGLQYEMFKAIITCFREDAFFGCVYFDPSSELKHSMFILPLNPDYCKIVGTYPNGEFAFAFDCSYFRGNLDLLEFWGEPFDEMYNQYVRDNQKWQLMPEKYSCCLKFRAEDWEVILPPFVGMFNALINLQDLEDIQAVADEQEIYKLIVAEMPTIKGTNQPDDFAVNPNLAVDYFNKLLDAIPSYADAVITPIPLDTITFNQDAANDTTKVQKATETVLNTSGGSQILNSASISGAEAFRFATKSDSLFSISSLLPQIERFVNRILGFYMKKPAIVKFFKVSAFDVDKLRDDLLEGAQYGLPNQLAVNTLNQISENNTMRLNYLEQEVLKIGELFKPMNSSYTSSYRDGTSEKDESELTDEGERTRDEELNFK